VPEALAGLTGWLNFHNLDRPHEAMGGLEAPGDVFPAQELPTRYWERLEAPPKAGPVEAARIVCADGRVDTWGQQLRIWPPGPSASRSPSAASG
jgi:hypothetical protein